LIIYGKNFLLSGTLFAWSALFTVLVILFSFNYFVLAGMGKIKERVKILAIATIINVILDVVLIKYIGIYGALISLIIARLTLFILSYHLISKIYKIKVNSAFIIKNTLLI